MSQEFDAIFENGVLRPLTPIELGEAAEVRVIVLDKNGVASLASPTLTELQQQQAALDAMFRQVDAVPQTPCNDGLSGRDHDMILYGSPP